MNLLFDPELRIKCSVEINFGSILVEFIVNRTDSNEMCNDFSEGIAYKITSKPGEVGEMKLVGS